MGGALCLSAGSSGPRCITTKISNSQHVYMPTFVKPLLPTLNNSLSLQHNLSLQIGYAKTNSDFPLKSHCQPAAALTAGPPALQGTGPRTAPTAAAPGAP